MIIHFSHAPSTYLFHPVPKILQNLEVLVLLLGVKAKKKFQQENHWPCFFGICFRDICEVGWDGLCGISCRNTWFPTKCILGYAWMHFLMGSNRLMWLAHEQDLSNPIFPNNLELGKTYLMLVPSIWNSTRPIESNRRVYILITKKCRSSNRLRWLFWFLIFNDLDDFDIMLTWFFFQIYEKQRFDDLVSFSDSLLSAYF